MPSSLSRSPSQDRRSRRQSRRHMHSPSRARGSRGRSRPPRQHSKSRSTSPSAPPPKRCRFFETAELHRVGAHHARTVNAFANFRAVLIAGYTRDPQRGDDEYTDQENCLLDEYMELCKRLPALHDALTQGGQVEIDNIAAELSSGASNARGTDVKTIKSALVDWGDWDPPYKPKDRHSLGFQHPQFGALLCPATMDWSDSEERLSLQNGTTKVTVEDFGRFFFPNNEPPRVPVDFPETFARSELGVQAGRAIFRGPSSSTGDDPVGHRSGNAQLNNMCEATIPAIAWPLTLVTHAISSNTVFTALSTGGFNYRTFYNNITKSIYGFDAEDRANLLAWWTGRVFGGMEPKMVKATCNGKPRETMLEKLKAATAQRKRAKAAARATGSAPVGASPGGTTPSTSALDD
ncbi:hypothetical protein CYLTODRAFT_444825 [Cylindrobasidium torrendii FP15055 ss-10]|uniref:Uncharacterized protein n=1 Tax=Cylindrobasidium torrendii FP15055 ss-10 TaxID=1314674 RepID=A0A0D7B6X0_9AGAR|nr:hypothetical protein CYLTODRAFT_444825 [Cylindrobasidium torrendii FP15055 ss-10]